MSDLRHALRALRATPVVTLVAVLSLALGIGANTAIFSIADSLLLRTLPVKAPDRLALMMRGPAATFSTWTNPIWEQVRDRRSELGEDAFAFANTSFDLAGRGPTDPVNGLWVSGRFFEGLGVTAILGRSITDADDERGGGKDGAVAVISHAFWQRRFGGAADVVGSRLLVDKTPVTIVGVAPSSFFGLTVGRAFDVALPIGCEPLLRGRESSLDQRANWWLSIMVRLRPGQTREDAQRALRGLQPQIREATLPPHYRPADAARYLKDPLALVPGGTGTSGLRAGYVTPVVLLMVVVGLVLLIACANIANLLLARAAARRHELSLRLALGAPRWRLARQLLVESLVIGAAGAAIGVIVAVWGSQLLVQQLSTATSRVFLDLGLDWRMLGFTAAVTLATSILFGLAPAFRASRANPMDAMRDHGRGAAGDRRVGFGSALVAVQVALSLVLLVAAGLFVRSFTGLATLDPGFEADPVLLVRLNAQRSQTPPGERGALYARILESLRYLPGVASTTMSAVSPASGATWDTLVEVEGAAPRPEQERVAWLHIVADGFFATYDTRVVAGRDFWARDTVAAARVAIVNEAFVRTHFGGARPLGRRIKGLRDDEWVEVVGVVQDAVYETLREVPPPTVYAPLSQWAPVRLAATTPPPSGGPRPSPQKQLPSTMIVAVRAAAGAPALLTRSIADAVGQIDRDLSLTFTPLRQQVDDTLIRERLLAMLSGFFGVLALLLAMLGLYGVTAHAVQRRQAEIGIRLALGATPASVLRLVLVRVGVLVTLGLAAGGALALWAGRFVESLLFGVEARDVATLGAAVLMLAIVAGLAGWLPARRASRLDPALVLRAD